MNSGDLPFAHDASLKVGESEDCLGAKEKARSDSAAVVVVMLPVQEAGCCSPGLIDVKKNLLGAMMPPTDRSMSSLGQPEAEVPHLVEKVVAAVSI